MTRTRTCQSDAERQRVVDEFQHKGFRVVSDGDDTTTLRKRDHGSLLAHVVLFVVTFWSFGCANVLYAMKRRVSSSETVRVVVGDD